MWNNVGLRLFTCILACLCCLSGGLAAQDGAPSMLLTPRRLKRLKLDSQRQTQRWANFEQRVKTVTDGPERGLELALYYAVTGDATARKQALEWLASHRRDARQAALVEDWCGAQPASGESSSAGEASLAGQPPSAARDAIFSVIARGGNAAKLVDAWWPGVLQKLEAGEWRTDATELAALYELIDVVEMQYRRDLRRDDSALFSTLPAQFLLLLPEEELMHPQWQTKHAALMMVTADPNLQSASFVQGWAMEDSKLLRDGPGVLYEFLLGNPYLPGLGFYNMNLWVYEDDTGRLVARSGWEGKVCRLVVTPSGWQTTDCPPDLRKNPAKFGKLTLMPVERNCAEVGTLDNGASLILTGAPPGGKMQWRGRNGQKTDSHAGPSGLFKVPFGVTGKICFSK